MTTATTRDRSCDSRIDEAQQHIEHAYADLFRKLDDEAARQDDDTEDSLREQLAPLSIDVTRVIRLMFSWGGPSDWIEVELDRNDDWYDVTRVTYHYADWFDHAEREVTERAAPALWRLAEYYGRNPDSYEC